MEKDRYKERNREIRERRANGEKLVDLAKEYGISKARVQQIAMAPEKTEPDDDVWVALKSAAERIGYQSVLVRTYNIVKRGMFVPNPAIGNEDDDWIRATINGIPSRVHIPFEQIPREKWGELRNCGKKCLELLYEAFQEK